MTPVLQPIISSFCVWEATSVKIWSNLLQMNRPSIQPSLSKSIQNSYYKVHRSQQIFSRTLGLCVGSRPAAHRRLTTGSLCKHKNLVSCDLCCYINSGTYNSSSHEGNLNQCSQLNLFPRGPSGSGEADWWIYDTHLQQLHEQDWTFLLLSANHIFARCFKNEFKTCTASSSCFNISTFVFLLLFILSTRGLTCTTFT